jgi:hypothetical protein
VATAAVIGRDFSFALLVRAARVSEREAAETVEELVRRRVLDTVGDRLEFSHDWIRRVADDCLLPAIRPTLHAAVGAALEELNPGRLDEVADQLGNHYSRAGDFRKALPHIVRFAELAAQRYALEEGSRAFEHALETVEQLPVSEHERARHRAALHERIGDMYALQWSAGKIRRPERVFTPSLHKPQPASGAPSRHRRPNRRSSATLMPASLCFRTTAIRSRKHVC